MPGGGRQLQGTLDHVGRLVPAAERGQRFGHVGREQGADAAGEPVSGRDLDALAGQFGGPLVLAHPLQQVRLGDERLQVGIVGARLLGQRARPGEHVQGLVDLRRPRGPRPG